MTKTQLGAAHANDARRATPNDLERYATAQPKLLKPAHLLRRAHDLSDLGNVAAAKLSDWEHFHGRNRRTRVSKMLRTNLNNYCDCRELAGMFQRDQVAADASGWLG
jgi:hypothetical protein